MKATDCRLVLIACADGEEAARIQETLVREKLAACVSSLPGVRSCYRWRGKIETAGEVLLLAKTTATAFEALRSRVAGIHSYEVPEIVALPVMAGHPPYLAWLADNTSAGRRPGRTARRAPARRGARPSAGGNARNKKPVP